MIVVGPFQLKIILFYSVLFCSSLIGIAGYWFNMEGTQTLERLVAAWDAKTAIAAELISEILGETISRFLAVPLSPCQSTKLELDQRPSCWIM